MKSSSLAAALAIALAAPNFSQASVDLTKLPAVVAFYKQPDFCMYMADIPETQSEAFEREFSRAVEAAVEAMRKRQPSLTQNNAILKLKAGCERSLGWPSPASGRMRKSGMAGEKV